MKRILLTGVNSYIGTNVEQYLVEQDSEQGLKQYQVDKISQRDAAWKVHDFSSYDTVLDVTGIAHVDTDKVSEEEKERYYQINCHLAVQTAQKAKREGVGQFIYLSSIMVYGEGAPVGSQKHITPETLPRPVNFYGDSKWKAEKQLMELADETFQVAILRLPFVYGADCKGNYQMLSKYASKFPIFPSVRNVRSMLYIEHLNEFLRLLIEAGRGGVFFPQNATHASTVDVIRAIREAKGRKMICGRIFNPFVRLAAKCPGKVGRLVNKAFGSLTYDLSMSKTFEGYQRYNLQESIYRTEKKGKL